MWSEDETQRDTVCERISISVCVSLCVSQPGDLLLGIIFQVGSASSLRITLIKTFLYYIFCAYCINTLWQFPEKAPSHACFKVIFFHLSF